MNLTDIISLRVSSLRIQVGEEDMPDGTKKAVYENIVDIFPCAYNMKMLRSRIREAIKNLKKGERVQFFAENFPQMTTIVGELKASDLKAGFVIVKDENGKNVGKVFQIKK